MRANRLAARHGLRWIGDGFVIFRASPLRQLVLNLAFFAVFSIVVALPLVGFVAVWLLLPAMMIGPHAISRQASLAARGEAPGWNLLFAGFREGFPAQLRLGGVYLAAMLLVIACTIPVDGGRFAQAMAGQIALDHSDMESPALLRAIFVGAVLQTAALGALWYAPLLVAWDRLPVSKAVFFSAAAAFINWGAFLVYGIAITVLFSFVLLLAFGAALLAGGVGPAQANTALIASIWTLLPVWFASSYLSYRDVFGAEQAPS
ncbi:MAG: BPSS1780 family membrane protein [Burkholderiales bacterium]